MDQQPGMTQGRRQFSSDLRELPALRSFVLNLCQQAWDTPADELALSQIELALAEAASNVVRHAYEGQPGQPIEVVVEADDQKIAVSLYHLGKGFDPDTVAPPEFSGQREGGFGIYLMRAAMDEVSYFHDEGGRHGVRLVKNRP